MVVQTPVSTKFYTDRSAAELDDKCGMAFFWNRLYGKRGIVPKKDALALRIGAETHEDLAKIAMMRDISADALKDMVADLMSGLSDDDRLNQPYMELLYRRMGWFVGFAMFIEPLLRDEYVDLGVEKELILDRDPLFIGVTPDRVLQNRQDKSITYLEYKTTKTCTTGWLLGWNYRPQLHLGMAAIGEELGQPVKFARIMALQKGHYSHADHRLLHPYVWAWYNHEQNRWTHSYEEARSKDWARMPVWEFPGGIVEWVSKCGPEVAKDQFPFTQPIFFNKSLLDGWVARRLNRERRIHPIVEVSQKNIHVRRIHFEMRTAQCMPPYGEACPFIQACYNSTVNENPFIHGEYIERTPHHDVEIIGVE